MHMDEKNVLRPLQSGEALCNGRIKFYPSRGGGEELAQIMICDKPIFNPEGVERRGAPPERAQKEPQGDDKQAAAAANFRRSCRRAKAKLYDTVMCTESFRYFVTLTVSPEAADRTNYGEIVGKLSTWLDNQVRRKGLCYVLVPEYHADGESIHFHGFFNDALPLRDSGKRTVKGQPIFNLPSFRMGFTTAIPLEGEYIAACRYILKYVGKSGQRVGKRFYLSGGALGRPRFEYFNGELANLEDGFTFSPEGSGLTFSMKKLL